MKSDKIIGAVKSVTKGWAKQRKAEERGSRRPREYYVSDRVNFTDIADKVLPDGYQHASGGGKLTVSKRQFHYACRDKFLELTGRNIDYSYFAQTLLVQYLNRKKPSWKITADPRGTLTIPNSDHEIRIPIGTIQIDNHLQERNKQNLSIGRLPTRYPSIRENERYAGVLYIEKEGFEPLIQEAGIAEKYDLAIMSCKGQSVVAARKFVDHVCHQSGVPLFIVHDFDKAGFEIAECLTGVSDAAYDADRVSYYFQNEINFVDFGLRLEDVEKYDLPSERCKYQGLPKSCTKEEGEFLRKGKRVELNAFTAPQFVEWLESKLDEHLPKKLIPTDDILKAAYQRAFMVAKINEMIAEMIAEMTSEDVEIEIPDNLRELVESGLETATCWDDAIYQMVESCI